MTKAVRIENADCATSRIVVQTWEKAEGPGRSDTLVDEQVLSTPAQQLEIRVYTGRYIVIKEKL